MNQPKIIKQILISSAVLSGFMLVGTRQANASDGQADTTDAQTTKAADTVSTSNSSVALKATTTSQASSINEGNSDQVSEDNTQETATEEVASSQTDAPQQQQATPDTQTIDSTADNDASTQQINENATDKVSLQQSSATTDQTPDVKMATQRKAAVKAVALSAKLDLTAQDDEIQAGESASFNLKLEVNGIDETTNEQHLVIDLPQNFKTSNDLDLTIDGVAPTLSEDGTQLIYVFKTPINGLSVSKNFIFQTADQAIINGTKITMAAQYLDGDTQLAKTEAKSVTVKSSAQYGVTNRMIGTLAQDEDGNILVDENGNSTINTKMLTGLPGDLLVYRVGISAPKSTLGQAYFEPGSTTSLKYMIPDGLTFVGVDNSTVTPVIQTSGGKTLLTFNMTAPSLEDQLAATDNLFNAYFNIVLRINKDTKALTKLTTQSQVNAVSINGENTTSKIASSTIQVSANDKTPITPTDGSAWAQYNWGPADGEGNLNEHFANIDPTVYPNATLAFLMQTGSEDFDYLDTDFGKRGKYSITKYIATYNVDPHLNVDLMAVTTPKSYVRIVEQSAYGIEVPLVEQPVADVYVRYQDETNFEATPIITDLTTTNGDVDMSQYVDNNRGVAQIQFVYKVHPQGLQTNTYFKMSPKAGYYGKVSNDFTVEIAGFDGDDWEDVIYSKDGAIVQGHIDENNVITPSWRTGTDVHLYDERGYLVPEGSELDKRALYNQYMAPQTAEIVAPAENMPRVLNESLNLLNQKNGLATSGDNTLQVMVENNQASVQDFSGLKSYVFLPKGMTYTGTDSNVTAEQVDNGTMLTINWAATSLAPNDQNKLDLAVNIAPELKLQSVTPAIYSTVTEKDTVAPANLDPDSNSAVQMAPDTSDIDGNPDTANVFVLQQRLLLDTDSNQIHVTATATNNAGQTGTVVTTEIGQDAQYGLSFTPNSDGGLTNVTIVGTLPTVDDTAVMDPDQPRGTTTAVTMTGPVVLPDAWQGLATVQYALASAPDTYVDAPAVNDFSQVVGFKLSYDGDSYLSTADTPQLKVPVKMSLSAEKDQVAYMSFSVAANGLDVTEGTKAGLISLGAGQPGPGIWVKSNTVTRTIEYRDRATNEMIAPSVTQQAVVTQTSVIDPETGEVVPGDWQLTDGGWTAVKSPDLSAQGYGPASQDVDAATVSGDSENTTITVFYDKTTGPSNPTDPTGPTDPSNPTNPSDPSNPNNPTTPTENPTTPQQPEVVPGEPDNNVVTGEKTTSPEEVTTNGEQANGRVDNSGETGLTAVSASGQATNATSKSAETLPQTDEQQSQLGLLGLLMATILGAFGVERKRRER
ncbi:hypothetical protein HC026_03210 [Lactobacillus sp. LC28-10]|uniref:Gram-positive cocci surface proteins LPxTG domain-containing protein n=1 Tax=Secundilactobacillus angelensis TaxID=2722706 RepID=A0ABX1KY66_9LACO|nr:hypothetical protein [Secundilactobacillus angelensis]MCH5461633.1 hypothetical protein [Secundilactobacillus angelensis]NLR17928.1 hypothetical protein [Secundilactobacillus angelensis]